MKMLKEKRAQGSIEILLLIGGAIAVATIIGLIVNSLASAPSAEIRQDIEEAQENLDNAS